jgi:hypothetical protein
VIFLSVLFVDAEIYVRQYCHMFCLLSSSASLRVQRNSDESRKFRKMQSPATWKGCDSGSMFIRISSIFWPKNWPLHMCLAFKLHNLYVTATKIYFIFDYCLLFFLGVWICAVLWLFCLQPARTCQAENLPVIVALLEPFTMDELLQKMRKMWKQLTIWG